MSNVYMSTTFDCPGYRVVTPLGLCWGTLVRSVGFGKSITGSFKALKAGEVSQFTETVDHARHAATEKLQAQAVQMGANAVLGIRFDSSDVGDGLAEVLAYGTAVVIEPDTSA